MQKAFYLNGKRYLKINNIDKLVNKFFRKEKKQIWRKKEEG